MCRYLLFWFTFNRTGKQVGRIEPKARPNDSLRRNPSVAAPRSIISSSPATCWRGTGPRPNHPGKSRHQTRNPEIPRGCNCTPEVRCCGSPRIDTRVGLPFPLLSKPRTITSLATRSPGGPTVEAQERQQMSGPLDDQLGFAPDYDAPVPYMQRTRDYYTAIGYTTPYRWAHYIDAPFQPLRKPLAQSRVTIVTTAAQFDPAKGDQGPGAAYNVAAKPRPLPRRQGRCRGDRAQLPGLSSDLGAGGASSRSQRHCHGRNGLRQGYYRTRRGTAFPVQRFPARQFRRQAAGRRVAGAD